MTDRKPVHIRDAEGKLLYDQLWDSGSECLMFNSGFGFIWKADCRGAGWEIVAEWVGEVDRRPRRG